MGEVIAFPVRRPAVSGPPAPLAEPPRTPTESSALQRVSSPIAESIPPGPASTPARPTSALPGADSKQADPASVPRSSGQSSHRATPREPLWREITGAVLRDERRRQARTLAEVAARAGMSVQYLSELERGRKEASSEMLAAACGSLGLGLAEFAQRCALTITSVASRPAGPVLLAA